MQSIHYIDDAVEIVSHTEKAIIHDLINDKYYETSRTRVLNRITSWRKYVSRVPNSILNLFFISLIALAIYDYTWFFNKNQPLPQSALSITLITFMSANIVLHECSHMVALGLCGRKPDKFGFKFNFYILPCFYIRMDKVMLLTHKEKLFCHLAGLWTNLLLVSIVATIDIFEFSVATLSSSAWIFLTMLSMNLIPLVNTDAQKALYAALDINQYKELRYADKVQKLIFFISVLFVGIIILRFFNSLLPQSVFLLKK